MEQSCIFFVVVLFFVGDRNLKNSDVMPKSHPRGDLIVLGVVWASEF